jgi:hypothetical protein
MNKVSKHNQTSPFACVMEAIEPGKREAHTATAKFLFRRVNEIREMPDGYSFRFSETPDLLQKLVEFIRLEKLCCPFFGFMIEIEPEGGSAWLKLTGREGVESFIQAEIGEFMATSIRF